MDKALENIFRSFGCDFFNAVTSVRKEINEVRVRCDKPVVIYAENSPYILERCGTFSLPNNSVDPIIITYHELKNVFSKLCEYSFYKYQNNINNGFITVKGGHRIGICGTAVLSDMSIKSVSDITSVNIRIAREYHGCSKEFFETVDFRKGVLICGVPSSGKTTLLRDIARILSTDYFLKISVIDERFEITSSFNGQTGFDLGLSDIYCGFPKEKAVFQAIRTMSPDIIICDELTGNDAESVLMTLNYGVGMIATLHCDSIENALKNSSIAELIKTKAFRKIIFLDKKIPCQINYIYDSEDIFRD